MAYVFKLPYGLRVEGDQKRLIHISEITPNESGLKCNCICPNCGVPLQAKLQKTDLNFTPRFAHHNADSCVYATETAIHMKAKEIIEKAKHIILPRGIAEYDGYTSEALSEKMISFDRIILERRMVDVIPDILAFKEDRLLMIEIKITHGVDSIKLKKIKKKKISTLEIDLSYMDKCFDPDLLYKEIVENTENKVWIYNNKIEEKTAELKEKVIDIRKKEEEARRKALQTKIWLNKTNPERVKAKAPRVARLLNSSFQDAQKKKWSMDYFNDPIWKLAAFKLKITRDNIPDYINLEIPGDFVFGCDRRIWQAYIFQKLIHNRVKKYGDFAYPISVEWVVEHVKETFDDKLIRDLIYLKDIQEYRSEPGLTDVIYGYLKKLEGYGFLKEQPARHIYYSQFKILYPESKIEPKSYQWRIHEIKQVEDLMLMNRMIECRKLLDQLLVKYSNGNQAYYEKLKILDDRLMKKGH